eukprot:GFUD01001985.1.p1 GENE.GFUD01001985.1~~GFUD01001985.1.p1  ORF type:complete len:134 (-),score=57.47 GFUD01001985.1:11-412(-)
MSDDDDGIGSGNEDELFYAEKEWRKLNEKSTTLGFKEGIGQASEDALQAGFDKGYADSFQTGLSFGKLRGKVAAKRFILGEDSEHIVELDAVEAELSRCENIYKDKPDDDKSQTEIEAKLKELETKFKLIVKT